MLLVRIDHPPINRFDLTLMLEFHRLGKQIERDRERARKISVPTC